MAGDMWRSRSLLRRGGALAQRCDVVPELPPRLALVLGQLGEGGRVAHAGQVRPVLLGAAVQLLAMPQKVQPHIQRIGQLLCRAVNFGNSGIRNARSSVKTKRGSVVPS